MGSEALADVFARRLDGTLDHVALREQASALLRQHVDVDLAVWAVLDPATLMWASCVLDGMPRDADLENGVFANEYGQPDHLKLVDLAGGQTAGTLSQVTAGDPQASRRFRDLLAPRGFSDELRLVLSDGGSSWGAVCLYRSSGAFPAGLATSLTAAARPLALALRSSLVRSTVLGPTPAPAAVDLPATGLLLADRSGRLREVNDDARALLGSDRLAELPQVVQSVVARRAAGHLGGATAVTSDGRWLTFHATPLGDALAVVVEQVRPHQLAEIIVRARGLTAREREVVELVARGFSNRHIARNLQVSEYTVQDHLKSVFVKFDVGSRNELVAALFFTHFRPLQG